MNEWMSIDTLMVMPQLISNIVALEIIALCNDCCTQNDPPNSEHNEGAQGMVV